MILTTKGMYAVIAMVDLLKTAGAANNVIRIAQIADNQKLSISYLEQIFAKLRAADIVASVKGPGGGYKLAKAPEEISVLDIMTAVDENIKMTRCSECKGSGCVIDGQKCDTHNLWKGLTTVIKDYFAAINIAQIAAGEVQL
jgi:Rrf2 family iron-sulfur cluster assembly transcriptional regulator